MVIRSAGRFLQGRRFAGFRALPLAGSFALAAACPAEAELRPEQFLGLGIQLLDQAQRSQNQAAPRQPAVQQPAAQQPAVRQQAPAARTKPAAPAQARRPRIPRSEAVAEAQRRLNAMGYNAGDVDGQAGPQTRRAIATFQRDHGLAQTGEANAAVLSALRGGAAAPASPAPNPAGGVFGGAPALAAGGFTAAAATRAAGIQTLPGIDLPGGDYRSGLTDPRLAGTGVDGCAALCASDEACLGFTYNTGADICILKDRVLRQDRYADAVSGIKGGAAAGVLPPTEAAATATAAGEAAPAAQPPAAAPGAPPTHADFVHMALMSDTEAYAAEASELGVQYLAAVGTDEQCKAVHAAQQADEFTRRDFSETAAATLRGVIESLAEQPRRVEMPIEQTVFLSEYDFDRQGFALPLGNSSSTALLNPGQVRLSTDARDRPYCRAASHGVLANLTAEHDGAAGIDFLPMSPEDARAFRAGGGNSVVIRATLVVEPRDQGRGPLKGQVTAVSAHDPASGATLHSWNVAEATTPSGEGDAPEWSGALLAALVAPALEPFLDDNGLERAAIAYFSTHANAIETGNPPPGSPLPVAEMRGVPPELIVSRNLEHLREVLREPGPALPMTVQVEQRVTPWFEDGIGLQFNAIETGIMTDGAEDPLSEIELSDRDLHLHEALLPQSLSRGREQSFKGMATSFEAQRVRMETDRILRLQSIPLTIEEAAARNLVGNGSTGERDAVILRWTLDLTEVRATEGEAVVSAAIKGLTYHWASDGTLLHDAAAEDFPTVAALRGEADAALGPVASADNILTPPDGTRWGSEMTDLLRLRHAPETVDDTMIERMMIARFNYEARMMREGEPLWGRFFRDVEGYLTPEIRKARLDGFRAWSEARAAALPKRLTLRVRLYDGPDGKASPFLPTGVALYQCRGTAEADPASLTELELAEARLCGFLEAARTAPDPLFTLPEGCEDDPYCQALNNARSELKIHSHSLEPELVRLDMLPLFDDAARAETGERALEIDVEVGGGGAQDDRPLTLWQDALRRAQPFAETYSLSVADRQIGEPVAPVMVFEAKAVAARLIDRETGAPVRDLLLGEPAPPLDEMLAMPESKVAGNDILGIRLGMSFEEADQLVRAHMEVGKVLTADRREQLSAASGQITAYSSGRIYASAAGDELIGILDEPPAAAGSVVGIWRVLRLPPGSTDPVALKATLVGRYGEPTKVQEVSLPFMQKGLAWTWLDVDNERCSPIDFGTQADLWRDEAGSTAWLPAFMTQPRYPVLHPSSSFDGVTDAPLPPANFCPAFLGVRSATYPGTNRGEPAGDEILTWLSDNRAYARLFFESRQTPAEPSATAASAGAQIKF